MIAKRRYLAFVLLTVLFGGVLACSKHSHDGPEAQAGMKKRYFCPMHPQYTSDKPGDCPICNMRLVPMKNDDAPSIQGKSGEKGKILYYRNPMNPAATSPVPAKDNMGMEYIPVYEGEDQSSVPVQGQASVRVSAESQQLVGVQISTVAWRDLYSVIHASARVAYDPALYSAITEHQEAVRALQNGSGSSPYRSEAEETVRASKLRLHQMGLSNAQIERVSQPGYDPANLLLGRAGGTVWVYVDLYDYEAPRVRSGSRVELTSPALSGRTYEGTVRAIDPIVNSETRTLRARVEVSNPTGELRPDMYLDATVYAGLGRKLSIPSSALLDTGTRQLAFVQTQPGHFEPREIRIGQEGEGFYEVMRGLKEGEEVVSSANFLIDSESKLRAAAQGPAAAPVPAREGTKSTSPPNDMKNMKM